MADIDDTKPIESVKAALSLFEQKNDQQNCCLNRNAENKKELDLLMKDLAYYKLHLEIKESAYMQAVAKLDVYQRTLTKLSSQLKLSETDRDKYLKECKKSQAFISMLESEHEEVIDQLVDSIEDHEKLLQTVDKLKHLKEELLRLKAELSAALTKAEFAEKAVYVEREKNKELLVRVSELNGAIFSSKLAAIEAEKVQFTFFAGMEAELQAATDAVIQSHEQLEQMKIELVMMQDLGDEVLQKSILSDYYQLELMQAKELLAARNYSMSIEAEAKRLEEDLKSARGEVSDLTSEIQRMKDESFKSNERELELQVEIATLKSEIHKSRSRIAAAEAAEARAMSAQSGLHLAVQQLAVEAESAKKEAQTLKLEMVSGITISVEEYESLIQKAKMVDDDKVENKSEVAMLKEELDAARAEIGDLKFTLEETARRAEMAENAKSAVEDQLRKWREKQKRRQAASESLEGQSARRSVRNEKPAAYNKHRTAASLHDSKIFNYVPLGKFLNMKF